MAENTGKIVTDAALRSLKPGEAATDSVPGRGNGAIYFECRPSGVVAAIYRYARNGKRHKVSMGNYKAKSRDAGFTLTELRAEAQRLALIATKHGDVSEYLAQQDAQAEAERIERKRQADIEAARGTFADLFRDYIESRRAVVADSTLREMERLFKKDMEKEHPAIMAMKARDIRPAHILAILNQVHERGSAVMVERLRAFLVAAFNHGLKAESMVGRANSMTYSLEMNPAALTSLEKKSAAAVRALTDAELKQFWQTIEGTPGVGPAMALLFKFVIATGGQRIKNIIETRWDDYDFEARTVRIAHRKGRKSSDSGAGGVVHIVPLSSRALEILEQVKALTGKHAWPWTTHGKQPFVISSPTHAIADWLDSDRALIDGVKVPSFSPRDLRRTCTQLMQKHGISDQLSDLLQAHGQAGVVAKHYRNNPEASLPEKWRAIEQFDRALSCVLEQKPVGNVVQLRGAQG